MPDGLANDEAERRIAAAVASHRIAPARAAHYRQMAKAGDDLSMLETLQPCDLNAPAGAAEPDVDEIYASVFPTVAEGRQRADDRIRDYETRAAAPATDQADRESYETIFGLGSWDR